MHMEAEIKLNSEMHLEAMIERVWRCTWRPRSSCTQRCTWRPRSCNSEMHLEAGIKLYSEMHLEAEIV